MRGYGSTLCLLLTLSLVAPAFAQTDDPLASEWAMQIANAQATVDGVSGLDARTRLQAQSDLAAAAFDADIVLRHDPSPSSQAVLASAADIRKELGGANVTNEPEEVLTQIPDQRAALQSAIDADDSSTALHVHGLLLIEAHDLDQAFRYVPTPEADRVRAMVAQLNMDLGLRR